jgi:hypothetical protein
MIRTSGPNTRGPATEEDRMDDQLDETGLRPQFDVALARYAEDAERLAELTERLALGEVKAVLPGAEAVEVHGWMNEDWLKVLRIRSVRSAAGEVLYDVETGAEPAVEDALHEIGTELLDLLVDLTGDAYMGTQELPIGSRDFRA